MTSRTRTMSTPSVAGTLFQTNYSGVTVVNRSIPKKPAYKVTTTDVVTPRFKERSSKGEIFNNPYLSVKEWYASNGTFHGEDWANPNDHSAGFATYLWSDGALFDIDYVPSAPVPDIDKVSLTNQAKASAVASVNKTEIMPYVTIAEWHKTKALHRDVGRAFLELFRSAYQRNPGRATSKSLANAWMLGRYGIMPVLYELQGAVNLLRKPSAPRYTSRGTASASKQTSIKPSLGDNFATYNVRSITTREVTIRAGILYEANSFFRFMARTGFTRPLSSAYELIPYSWVLDWWIDVGTWLDAIQPDGASKYLAAWITVRDRITYVSIADGVVVTSPSCKRRSWDGQRTLVTESYERFLWDGSPPILPTYKGGPTGIRCFDAIALVTQKLGFRRGTGNQAPRIATL